MNDRDKTVLNMFSVKLRNIFVKLNIDYTVLQEIRLRCNNPIILIYNGREYYISESEGLTGNINAAVIADAKEIRETMEYISNYSMYAFEEELKQGYITVTGGHRVGLCGKVIMEKGSIKTIKYISFINIRLAHEIKGCSEGVLPYLYNEYGVYNTLIISPPMHGKTTLMRDIIRNISNRGISIGLADERSEIAASYLGVPQNDVGMRTDVLDAVPKKYGIMMLIRTMSPKIVAVDEIGSESDCNAIMYGVNCGCGFLCTIHGSGILDVIHKSSMKEIIENDVFKRFVVIKNEQGRRYAEIYDNKYSKIGNVRI